MQLHWKGGLPMQPNAAFKIARALYVLVLIALVCNIILLYLVPASVVTLVSSDGGGLLDGAATYLGGLFFSW